MSDTSIVAKWKVYTPPQHPATTPTQESQAAIANEIASLVLRTMPICCVCDLDRYCWACDDNIIALRKNAGLYLTNNRHMQET